VSPPDSERNQPDDERVVALHRVTLTAVDFRRARFDTFSLGGCLFDRCDFRGLKLDRRLAPLFVALPRSVFRNCNFDGADLRRALLGQSRFERCTFDDARIDGGHTETAEFVDCRFAGPLDNVTFYGAPSAPEAKRLDPPRRRNEFRGNDFRDAELLDVAFVAGVDMALQRFPTTICMFGSRASIVASRKRAPTSRTGMSATARRRWRCSRLSRLAGEIRMSSSRAAGPRASRRRTAYRLVYGKCSSTSDRARRVVFDPMRSRGPTYRIPR